jgi:type I restriction enzyme S subunit
MKKGWITKKLSDVMTIERGGSPRPIEKYLTDSPNGINWIKISDATASDKYIYETQQKITKEGLSKTRLVHEGDFLLSNSMSFGRPYIMKTTGCIHDGWLVLRNKPEV